MTRSNEARQAFTVFGRHGGALDAARRAFPQAPEPWIDLSTGLNPVPYAAGAVPDAAWARLPDVNALAGLERAAAARYGVPDATTLVAAPGTQALIQHLPTLRDGDDVRVLGPTYGEYEAVFGRAGCRVGAVTDTAALAGADVAAIVNPNNPDGRRLAPDALVALAGRVGLLVVDEAFADLLPLAASVAGQAASRGMVVLRSFGKTYGLAGLRLGFAVAAPRQARRLRDALGPWPVSGPAIVIATRALGDQAWLDAARTRLEAEAARLAVLLQVVGARPLGGTLLFQLIDHAAAETLFMVLAEHGILTRPFANHPTRLRFGLPGDASAWARLEGALRAFNR